MPAFKSLKKPLLSKEVEKQLKLSILNKSYNAGKKLPSERELVDQFQVSRVTVREALRGLQQSGLVQIKRGREAGAYVCEPDSTAITDNFQNLLQMGKVNFSHLIEIRLYTEPDVARTAALHRTSEDIDTLIRLLDKAETYSNTSPKKARLMNVQFHCEVAKILDNAMIIFLCESVTQVYSANIIEMTHTKLDKKAIEKFISEHREILDAIVKRKPEEAFERTKKHLIETYYTYSKIIPDSYDEDVDKRIRYFAGL